MLYLHGFNKNVIFPFLTCTGAAGAANGDGKAGDGNHGFGMTSTDTRLAIAAGGPARSLTAHPGNTVVKMDSVNLEIGGDDDFEGKDRS